MEPGRLFLVVLSVAALLAMTVHYGAVEETHDPYPTARELADDYDSHVGEEFYMWMNVVDIEGETLVLAETLNRTLVLRTGPAPPGVEQGDIVQVYGVLEPDHRISPRRVVVSSQDDRAVMFAVSGLAAVFAVALFFREWTVDRDRYAFVPRGDGDG